MVFLRQRKKEQWGRPLFSLRVTHRGKMKDIDCHFFQDELFLSQLLVYALQERKKMRTISIRLNDNDYDMLNEMLSNMGQTKQTFYESYTKTALRLRRIPFLIEDPLDPFYSESNMTRLHESEQQFHDGKIVVKTLDELERMTDE